MKKLLSTAAVCALALAPAGPASADSTDNLLIQGTVVGICAASGIPATVPVDLLNGGPQLLAAITYTCTLPGGFTRSFSSANGGLLQHDQSAVTVPYNVSHDGTNGLAFAPIQLSSTITDAAPLGGIPDPVFAAGVSGNLNFTLQAVNPNLFEGLYEDTLTVSVTANITP